MLHKFKKYCFFLLLYSINHYDGRWIKMQPSHYTNAFFSRDFRTELYIFIWLIYSSSRCIGWCAPFLLNVIWTRNVRLVIFIQFNGPHFWILTHTYMLQRYSPLSNDISISFFYVFVLCQFSASVLTVQHNTWGTTHNYILPTTVP